jgi:hypothetical protein
MIVAYKVVMRYNRMFLPSSSFRQAAALRYGCEGHLRSLTNPAQAGSAETT